MKLEESVTVADLRELANLFLLCRRCLTRAVLSAFFFLFLFLFLGCSPAALLLLFRYLNDVFSGCSFFLLLIVSGVSLELFS